MQTAPVERAEPLFLLIRPIVLWRSRCRRRRRCLSSLLFVYNILDRIVIVVWRVCACFFRFSSFLVFVVSSQLFYVRSFQLEKVD